MLKFKQFNEEIETKKEEHPELGIIAHQFDVGPHKCHVLFMHPAGESPKGAPHEAHLKVNGESEPQGNVSKEDGATIARHTKHIIRGHIKEYKPSKLVMVGANKKQNKRWQGMAPSVAKTIKRVTEALDQYGEPPAYWDTKVLNKLHNKSSKKVGTINKNYDLHHETNDDGDHPQESWHAVHKKTGQSHMVVKGENPDPDNKDHLYINNVHSVHPKDRSISAPKLYKHINKRRKIYSDLTQTGSTVKKTGGAGTWGKLKGWKNERSPLTNQDHKVLPKGTKHE